MTQVDGGCPSWESDLLLTTLCASGTLGLAVTYCCRGEEETTLMKIAQKCNVSLLPLPGMLVCFVLLSSQ